jgi:alpha-D-ribose 1-methylphosphonate 5-triphosphate synthase subunit PhnH
VPDLLDRLALNASLFPRGIDLVLVSGESIVALPRTTRLVAKEG